MEVHEGKALWRDRFGKEATFPIAKKNG